MEQGAIIPSRFGSGLAVMNKARAGAIEYGEKEGKMADLQSHLDKFRIQQRLRDAGLPQWTSFTTSVAVAQAWVAAGFTPTDAKAWRDDFCRPLDGGTPQEAANWRSQGLTPKQALRQARRRYPSPQRTK